MIARIVTPSAGNEAVRPPLFSTRRPWIALPLLILAGLLGNRFTIPLFFGADFIFGSVAVLLTLHFYGLCRGVLVALVVHAVTYLLWGHPFSWITFVGEALWVGFFLRRQRLSLLELDGLFWLIAGMPLAWFFHGGMMQMDAVTATFIMLKQAINGIFNALLVSIAITYLPLDRFFRPDRPTGKASLQESLSYLLILMVLLPSLILTGVAMIREKERLERGMVTELEFLSSHVQSSLLAWHDQHMRAIRELAARAAAPAPPPHDRLQAAADLLQATFADFVTVHVEDARGQTIAFSPPVNERGGSNLGLDFSGRPWFQAVRDQRKEQVSESFLGYMAVSAPIVNFSVPILRGEQFAGCATGTLDLKRSDALLRAFRSERMTRLTLSDPNERIIASTVAERAPLQPWNIDDAGETQSLNDRVYLWRPAAAPMPALLRWRGSFYVREVALGAALPWKLTIEAAVAPLQEVLYRTYVKHLAVMAALMVLALLLSHLISRGIARPLVQLARETINLPEKISRTGEVQWPSASTREVEALIGNIRTMAGALEVNFTKLKLQRDALRKTNRQLRREMAERKRSEVERLGLEERLRRAEKMEAIGLLAGGVAHDLNNVLGVLVGYSELLLEKFPVGTPLRRYGERILGSGLKGAAIIQDLLTLARRGVSVSEAIDLNSVVGEYLRSPEFEALKGRHPGVGFRSEQATGLLNIKGSPVHLGKTVMNLIANGAEAIAGVGEVTVQTENRHLDRPLEGYDDMPVGDYVTLTVSDTGGGISGEDLGKIFEPFYTKKVMGRSGTGLGLAVVWGTVKDHGGYIDVRSREGEGSVFTLYFPVTREAVAGERAAVLPSSYQGRGERILVVDDVLEQRELATSMLTRLGYAVTSVGSGEEALVWLADHEAELVVLDMIMDPGLDGLETYRRVLSLRPGQKAVIVSGFSETERVRQAQALGAGGYVRKPYILEKIGLAVRRELDGGADEGPLAAGSGETVSP